MLSLSLQTLDIVAENPDKFRVVALAAGSNVTLLADQVSSHLTCSVAWYRYSSASRLSLKTNCWLSSSWTAWNLMIWVCFLTGYQFKLFSILVIRCGLGIMGWCWVQKQFGVPSKQFSLEPEKWAQLLKLLFRVSGSDLKCTLPWYNKRKKVLYFIFRKSRLPLTDSDWTMCSNDYNQPYCGFIRITSICLCQIYHYSRLSVKAGIKTMTFWDFCCYVRKEIALGQIKWQVMRRNSNT